MFHFGLLQQILWQVMKKLKKHSVSAYASAGKMDAFTAPGKNIQPKNGAFLGKLVRIVADTSHLCGHLIDAKSHAGSNIIGQPVFKAHLKGFIPQAEKAPHHVCIHLSESKS